MALLENYTADELKALNKWIKQLPKSCRKIAEKYPPTKLYFDKSCKLRVVIISYYENGTVGTSVLGKYNLITFERNVFGVQPGDLSECDLPSPNEKVGVLLTDEKDIKDFIKQTVNKDKIRASRYKDN